MTSIPQVSLTIPAMSEFIAVARLSVSGIAARMNFTVEEIEDIKIALSEACTNAIQHAYDTAATHTNVDIQFLLHPDKLEMVVKDTGKGFDPKTTISSKITQDSPQFGLGLGLTFIKSLMDEAIVESHSGKGTVVRMIKYVPHTIPA